MLDPNMLMQVLGMGGGVAGGAPGGTPGFNPAAGGMGGMGGGMMPGNIPQAPGGMAPAGVGGPGAMDYMQAGLQGLATQGSLPQQPGKDAFGIDLPPPPGGHVGQQNPNGGLMDHMGGMTGGGQVDPTLIDMILRLLQGTPSTGAK